MEAQLATLGEVTEEWATGVMKVIQKETGIKGKNLYMPIRGAMIGSVHGPDMKDIFLLLGKEKIQKRIEKARSMMRS